MYFQAGRKSFIVFKNTIEECESLVDRSFLVETANLEEHIKFNEGKRHVYKLVNLLNQIDYLDPESLILDRASLAEYRNNITEEKAKKEEAIAAWYVCSCGLQLMSCAGLRPRRKERLL